LPNGYKIRGIEPPDLRDYPASVKKLYWSWVVELGIKAKDRDLAAGLDKDGEALEPISEKTRKNRRSEMTPSRKGSPSAPPLTPAYHKSRTRSLLSGRALTTHADFFWRYDAWTGASWAEILTYQIAEGRDVFGLSPDGTAWVQAQALKRWNAWKQAGQPATPLATAPLSGPRAIPVEPPQFAPKTIEEFNAFFRASSMTPIVPFRPAPRIIPHPTTGPNYTRLLGHVWGGSRGGGGGGGGGGPTAMVPRPIKPAPMTPRPIKPAPRPIKPAPRPIKPAPRPIKPAPMTPMAKPEPAPNRIMDAVDITATAPHKDQLVATMRAINSVHHLGTTELTKIPVVPELEPKANGSFWSIKGDKPLSIKIKQGGDTPGLTMAHEVGHYLDQFIIPGGEKGRRDYKNDQLLKSWRQAVQASASVQELKRFATQYRAEKNSEGIRVTKYFLRFDEIWARSYAQYIATKSGNRSLIEEVESLRVTTHGEVWKNRQWGEADFAPILKAMDDLFIAIGWQ
jgi:hypothetical protein